MHLNSHLNKAELLLLFSLYKDKISSKKFQIPIDKILFRSFKRGKIERNN